MPPIGSRHAAAVTILTRRLIEHAGEAADVRVQSPLRLGAAAEPQPDVALVKRRPDDYKSAHPGPGDVLLVIEVSEATLRFDMQVKARLYAAHGVPECWVVDLARDGLHRYRLPREGRYESYGKAEGGRVRVDALGAELAVRELF
jgi:Uma2 family endonuclease